MVFWIGILIAALFAWLAVKMGFVESWTFAFNIVISVYLAVFLGPLIANAVTPSGDAPYSSAIAMLVTAVASFLILHGISYTFLTGQFSVSFPRVLEILGAGFLGFLAGFLIWSFVSLLICITPISKNSFAEAVGLSTGFEQTSAPYICWWCDLVNTVVSSKDSELTSEEAISKLLKNLEKKPPAKPPEPATPNDAKERNTEKLTSTNVFVYNSPIKSHHYLIPANLRN